MTAAGFVNLRLDDGRWVGEHRLVLAGDLGRPLREGRNGETVRHLDGDRGNNHPSNLLASEMTVTELARWLARHHRDEVEQALRSEA